MQIAIEINPVTIAIIFGLPILISQESKSLKSSSI